jgi:hypothetical protein
MFCIRPIRDQDIRATIRCQKCGGRGRNFTQNRNFMHTCRVDMACRTCRILWSNLLKPDSYELNNCRDERQIVSAVTPFLEERSHVQVERIHWLQNNSYSFRYHLGICWQDRSHSGCIWLETWICYSAYQVSILWLCDLLTGSTYHMVMYSRKTVTYHQLQDDPSHHVRQHARMATSLLHTPFIFAEMMHQQMPDPTQM